MKTKDLLKKDRDELKEKLDETVKELTNLKFDLRVGQETDYSEVKKKKKLIARIKTILSESN